MEVGGLSPGLESPRGAPDKSHKHAFSRLLQSPSHSPGLPGLGLRQTYSWLRWPGKKGEFKWALGWGGREASWWN